MFTRDFIDLKRNTNMLNIRKANEPDLEHITAIYNDAILTTTATFDTEIKTLENRKQWFAERDKNFPVLVAELNKIVVGYAALNKWSERKAYNITAENSLYVQADFRAKGIGKLLLSEIVNLAHKETNLHSLIARISEGNEQSIYIHTLTNFEIIGVMRQAGSKFGKLHDVTFMQRMLR